LIIAHRGASSHAPENTLAAFQAATDAGADGVEFDVRLAADGVPVVIHDANLKRTGWQDVLVSRLTSNELGEIDVGSWFNRRFPNRSRPEFDFQTVPTLAKTLRMLHGFDGRIYIELKAGDADLRDLVKATCGEIRSSPLLPQIIVKSFKLAAIPEVRHHLPVVATGALFSAKIMYFLKRRRHIVALAREFGADHISIHRSLVTRDLARAAAEAALPVTVWTVDDPAWIDRGRKLGIGALITNDPSTFITHIRRTSPTGCVM